MHNERCTSGSEGGHQNPTAAMPHGADARPYRATSSRATASVAIRSPSPTRTAVILIRCQIVSRMDLSQVRAVCEAAMREYGVPVQDQNRQRRAICGDGPTRPVEALTRMDEAGDRSRTHSAGRPQQNGRHERMHRTLKEDTTKPAALTLRLSRRSSTALDRYSTTNDLMRD